MKAAQLFRREESPIELLGLGCFERTGVLLIECLHATGTRFTEFRKASPLVEWRGGGSSGRLSSAPRCSLSVDRRFRAWSGVDA